MEGNPEPPNVSRTLEGLVFPWSPLALISRFCQIILLGVSPSASSVSSTSPQWGGHPFPLSPLNRHGGNGVRQADDCALLHPCLSEPRAIPAAGPSPILLRASCTPALPPHVPVPQVSPCLQADMGPSPVFLLEYAESFSSLCFTAHPDSALGLPRGLAKPNRAFSLSGFCQLLWEQFSPAASP